MGTSTFVRVTSLWIALSLGAISCSRDKQQFLNRANQAFNEKRYTEAIIDYKRALQQDPRFAEARYKLAESYDKLGDGANAAAEYVRAADLLPNDPDAQVRAGVFLLAGGAFEDARKRALNALAKNPRHVEAQILLAQSTLRLKDVNEAVTQIEHAIQLDPSEPRIVDALAEFRLAQGDPMTAEAAFKRAVALDPKSLPANLSLGRFYLAVGKNAEAEEWLKKAVAIAPDDPVANRALAALYMKANRFSEAEAPLKASVKNAPSSAQLTLVDYYILVDRKAEARKLLDTLKDDKNVFTESRLRLSILEWRSGHPAEARRWVDSILAKNPHDSDATVLQARYLLLDGKVDEARDRLKKAVDDAPQQPAAHYWLGVVYRGAGDLDGARAEFAQVQKLVPSEIDSKLQLAQISVQQGKLAEAEIFANDAVKAQPLSGRALLNLIDVLTAQGKLTEALKNAERLFEAAPNMADPQVRIGRIYLKQDDYPGAEKAFRRALQVSPNSNEAVTGLVETLVSSGRLGDARRTIEESVARDPKNVSRQLVAARVYRAQHDDARAETALKSALASDPNNLSAYVDLARVYISEKRLDEARTQLDALAARQPKLVWAQTMGAMIVHLQNRVGDARERYERILSLDPHAVVASNNLAMLLLHDRQNIDRALELAQIAKQRLPDNPEVNDTLGSVFLEKGLGSLAIEPLRISVQKEPSNPAFHYHLGQAYALAGRKTEARVALERALALNAAFEGAAGARELLAGLRNP